MITKFCYLFDFAGNVHVRSTFGSWEKYRDRMRPGGSEKNKLKILLRMIEVTEIK